MQTKTLISLALAAALTTGCMTEDDPNRRAKIGAVTGAIAGAVIGNNVGDGSSTNRVIGAIVGGVEKVPKRLLVDRLTGLAAAPVLIGAIAMVHWPRWSFVASESHPMGSMEFPGMLLGVALIFLLGARSRA